MPSSTNHHSHDKGEQTRNTEFGWQRKALLAGRMPLPTSKPKKVVGGAEVSDSDSDEFSSISEDYEGSPMPGKSSHTEDENKCSIKHTVSAAGARLDVAMRHSSLGGKEAKTDDTQN
ncbi:hypothetical protein TARUN_1168 [Trichoderma arundinaceum]|uniref:Uncharacterized protein n=1 Tax=Trichoderma arundinaceum TaxID=490622 RepID=A0A395NYB3_TRIAR|nr:hypothetical protein TARUN_1168 [Trichoderma arundinaceum]